VSTFSPNPVFLIFIFFLFLANHQRKEKRKIIIQVFSLIYSPTSSLGRKMFCAFFFPLLVISNLASCVKKEKIFVYRGGVDMHAQCVITSAAEEI
jgi:hypothetical protein